MMKTACLVATGLAACLAQPALAEEDRHPELMGAVKAFHDVLSVDWHAEPGAARNAAACANADRYVALAGTVAAQDAPGQADDGAWQAGGAALRDASAALDAYCASAAPANVEAGLSTIHDRFHDLMALLARSQPG